MYTDVLPVLHCNTMPFYELVCISRKFPAGNLIKTKELVKQSALNILDKGGVVRKIQYLATQRLPYRMRRRADLHDHGIYWTMQFYSNTNTMDGLRNFLDSENDVIKQTVIKLGTSLGQIAVKEDSKGLFK